jgi:hypothetical protein
MNLTSSLDSSWSAKNQQKNIRISSLHTTSVFGPWAFLYQVEPIRGAPQTRVSTSTSTWLLSHLHIPPAAAKNSGFCLDVSLAFATSLYSRDSVRAPDYLYSEPQTRVYQIHPLDKVCALFACPLVLACSSIACRFGVVLGTARTATNPNRVIPSSHRKIGNSGSYHVVIRARFR